MHGLDEICMPLGVGDDGYEVNAPKGYPCDKAAQQRRNSGKIQKKRNSKSSRRSGNEMHLKRACR